MQDKGYSDFDLLIVPYGAGYRAKVITSLAGEATIEFDHPFPNGLPDQVLGSMADRDALPKPAQPGEVLAPSAVLAATREIGLQLYRTVFRDEVETCFRRSLDKAETQNKGLRIRLRLTDVPDLAGLPWEYLCQSGKARFLGNSVKTPIVRYVEIGEPVEPLTVHPPLAILVMISSPRDHDSLAVEREWENLREAMADLVDRGLVRIERLPKATHTALRHHLRKGGPFHIFHFIGHGVFDAAREAGALIFEDSQGNGQAFGAEDLGLILGDHKPLRLAWLNACRTAEAAATLPFAGLAQTLIQNDTPAVIAMQRPITDAAALVLSQAFYGALADGDPVDTALTCARQCLFSDFPGSEWGTPVLFMRAADGRIFTLDALDAKKEDDGQDPKPRDERHLRPLPISPSIPELPSLFVGRAAEVERIAAVLAEKHAVVITGMRGIGKTSLTAAVARQVWPVERVFWHSFRPGEGLEAIIAELARFLAGHGQSRFWEILDAGQRRGAPLPPPAQLLTQLIELARGHDFLIVLDDLQHVDRDPLIGSMVERFRDAVASGELKLLAASERKSPFPLDSEATVVLSGLGMDAVRDWVTVAKLKLSVTEVAALHAATDGSPQLLLWAIQACLECEHPGDLIERLEEVDDIERFLLCEVYDQLRDSERAFMQALAVLQGYPGSRAAIGRVLEAAVDRVALRRAALELADRHLITVQRGAMGIERYGQHALVQAFYYSLIEPEPRRAMHQRLGEHFEAGDVDSGEAPDSFHAARHYERGADAARAAVLVERDLWLWVNQGHAHELTILLARLSAHALDEVQRAGLAIVEGKVRALLGDGTGARACFARALEDLDRIEASRGEADSQPLAIMRVRTCHAMGRLVQFAAPREALEWFERGLIYLEAAGSAGETEVGLREAAALHVYTGATHMALGEYEQALVVLERGQALLPPEASRLKATVLLNLASVYGNRGDLIRARAYTQEGLAVCEAAFDDFTRIELLNNLAVILELGGEWSEAQKAYEQAMSLVARIGDVTRQAKLALNRGILAMNQGDDPVAVPELERCMAAARTAGLNVVLIAGLASVAELHLRRGRPEQAAPLVAEAGQVAEAIGSRAQLAEIDRLRALQCLASGDVAKARERIERSLALARELGREDEEGRSLCVLGQVLAARGESAEWADAAFAGSESLPARGDRRANGGDLLAVDAAFERSVKLLAEEELYEAARCRLAWARVLAGRGDSTRATTLAREARLAFRGLGARYDEGDAGDLLRSLEGGKV